MRKSTDSDSLAALEEVAPRGVSSCSDTPNIILREHGSARNDATCKDPAISEDGAEPCPQHPLAANSSGDVATTNTASSAQPTGYQLYHAARAHRSFSLGKIIIAVIHAAGATARRAHARHRQHRQARAIYDALRQLDDHTLRDLGFDRSEITSVAAEMTGEAEYTRVRVLSSRPAFASAGADPRTDSRPSSQQKNAVSITKEKCMTVALVRFIGIALVLAALASSAFAADKSLSVMEKVDLPVPPAKAWETIREFDGWQNWHPAIGSTDIPKGKGNTKGTVRVLNTKDGAKITEELLSHNDKSRTYQYKITESPLPVTNYISTIKVVKAREGSTVIWSSDFIAKQGTADEEAKKVIAGIYTAGLDSLKSKLK